LITLPQGKAGANVGFFMKKQKKILLFMEGKTENKPIDYNGRVAV